MTEKSKEHSAIDSIYNMEESINNLNKRVKNLEGMLTLALNKLDQLSKKNQAAAPVAVVKVDSSQKQVSQQKVEKLLVGKVKVYGKIVNKSLQPLYGVLVNIYDSSSELVKSIKTDDEGLWEVRLPGGKYGVEYVHKNFKPINRTIEFSNSEKTFEVT
jgi:flagellar hook assembly protein FlgD